MVYKQTSMETLNVIIEKEKRKYVALHKIEYIKGFKRVGKNTYYNDYRTIEFQHWVIIRNKHGNEELKLSADQTINHLGY